MQIVDAFVATLGLDDRQYREGMKRYRDDRKRISDEDAKQNRNTQDAQRKTVEGIRTLRNEVAGFLVVLGGATGIANFVKELLNGAAVTGRFAANIGLTTERVSVWENVIKRVGGSAADARNVLGTLAKAFQDLQLMGTTGNDADFQGLGITAKDLANPEDALLKIADASSRMPRLEFTNRLKRLGFDEATITLLAKGRAEVTRLTEEQIKLGVTTEKDARAAQELEDKLARLESGIRQKALPIISRLADRFADWLGDQDNLNAVLETSSQIFEAMGVVASGVITVFEALSDAIREIGAAWKTLPQGVQDFGANLGNMLTGGSYKNAWDYIGDAIGGPNGQMIKDRLGAEKNTRDAPSAGGAADTLLGGLGFGPSGGGAASGAGNRSAASVEQYFKARGYTAAQARGIAAAVVAEGGLTQPRGGGYKGRALGIGQLLGDRRKEFLRRYGNNFTFANELEFMHYELQGGDPGGAKVRAQTTERGVLRSMIDDFYRPAKGRETIGDWNRGLAHLAGGVGGAARASAEAASSGANWKLRGAGTVTQTTNIGEVTVYTAATDAQGIARDMRGELAKRGLVVQANTGLQP